MCHVGVYAGSSGTMVSDPDLRITVSAPSFNWVDREVVV